MSNEIAAATALRAIDTMVRQGVGCPEKRRRAALTI